MIVLGEAHLRRILTKYAAYYNELSWHLPSRPKPSQSRSPPDCPYTIGWEDNVDGKLLQWFVRFDVSAAFRPSAPMAPPRADYPRHLAGRVDASTKTTASKITGAAYSANGASPLYAITSSCANS